MNKNDFLKSVAETAYNVGFGAKKHFATYDIVEKTPGLISFLSLAVGVFALFIDDLTAKPLSATFVVLGIVGLYVTFYDQSKEKYETAAVQLTTLFNSLRDLYHTAKAESSDIIPIDLVQKLKDIESKYYAASISKQILFSDWYAHYKFFWQHQIEWVDEQKKFDFFRDKVPLSFSLSCVVGVIALVVFFIKKGVC